MLRWFKIQFVCFRYGQIPLLISFMLMFEFLEKPSLFEMSSSIKVVLYLSTFKSTRNAFDEALTWDNLSDTSASAALAQVRGVLSSVWVSVSAADVWVVASLSGRLLSLSGESPICSIFVMVVLASRDWRRDLSGADDSALRTDSALRWFGSSPTPLVGMLSS